MADAGELNPAEAQTLLYPHEATGRSALCLALATLIAHGVLRLEQTREKARIAGTKTNTWVRLGPAPPPTAPAYAVSIVDAVRTAQASGSTLDAVLTELPKELGCSFTDFKSRHIVPALEARGLMTARQKSHLLVMKKTVYEHSAAGEAMTARVQDKLADARTIPQLLASDPARAAAVAVATGDLIIFVYELIPHYAPLAAALRAHAAGNAAYVAMADALDALAGRSDLEADYRLAEDNSSSPGG